MAAVLTRAVVDRRLLRDNRDVLVLLGRAAEPGGDPNAAVGDALADALMHLGYAVADLDAGPTDADLLAVGVRRVPHLLALADLGFKEGLLGNLVAWASTQYGVNREEFASMAESLRKVVQQKRAMIQASYGMDGHEFVAGDIAPRPQPPDAIDRTWLDLD